MRNPMSLVRRQSDMLTSEKSAQVHLVGSDPLDRRPLYRPQAERKADLDPGG